MFNVSERQIVVVWYMVENKSSSLHCNALTCWSRTSAIHRWYHTESKNVGFKWGFLLGFECWEHCFMFLARKVYGSGLVMQHLICLSAWMVLASVSFWLIFYLSSCVIQENGIVSGCGGSAFSRCLTDDGWWRSALPLLFATAKCWFSH